MTQSPLSFDQVPHLTDEAANQILEFLLELTAAFENKYGLQLRRYDQEQQELHWERQHQQQMHHQAGTQDEESTDWPF